MFGFKSISINKIVSSVVTTIADIPAYLLMKLSGENVRQNVGTAIFDSGPASYEITNNGSVTQSAFSPFEQNWSTYFNGSGDYITLPSSGIFNFGTGDFTIECWINPSRLVSSQAIAGSSYGTTGGTLYLLNDTVVFNTNLSNAQTPAGSLLTGEWAHIAAVRSGSTLTIYINGIARSSDPAFTTNLIVTNAVIGANPASPATRQYRGYISNLRVVKAAVYTSAFIPSTTPLTVVANTSLLTCQNGVLLDNSTFAASVTSTGSPSAAAFSPFGNTEITSTPTNSIFFTGTSYINAPSSCVQFGTGNFTMEAWIYPTSASDMNIFSRSWGGSNFIICSINGGVINFWMGHPNSGWVAPASANTAIKINQWQHIAVTRNGTAVNIWVNGISVASATSAVDMNSSDTTPLSIGRYPFSGSAFSGYMSNVRIVNGTAIYTSAFTPPTSALSAVTNTSLLVGVGNVLTDLSASALTLTNNGAARISSFSPLSAVPTITTTAVPFNGNYGNAYSVQFNGSSYLSAASNSALNLGSGNFTIELWFNQSAVKTTSFMAMSDAGSTGYAFGASGTANKLWWYTGASSKILSSSNFQYGVWNHAAMVRVGSTTTMYLNGTSVGSYTDTTTYSGTTTYIGTDQYGQSWNGNLSNVRIVKGIAVYTANFTPPTAPLLLVSGTEILACATSTLVDNSSNNFTLTATGTPQVSTTSPFTVSSARTYPSNLLFAGSARFTPSTTSLELPAGSSISGTGDFTADFWIYPETPAPATAVLFETTTTGGLSVSMANSGIISFSTTGGSVIGTTTTGVNLNSWNHIAICRIAGTLRMFINGSQQYSGSSTTNFVSGTVRIGSGNAIAFYRGLMSNFRLQRQGLYVSAFKPSLLPITREATNSNTAALLTFDSYGATDSLGQQLPFATTGTVAISSTQTKNGNTSMFFNGATSYLTLPTTQQLDMFSGNFTVEAWIYPSSVSLASRTEHVACFTVDINNRARLYFNGPTFVFSTASTAAGEADRITTTAVAVNTWSHIALVKQSSIFTLFINGVSVGTSSTTVLPVGSQTLLLGNKFPTPAASSSFTGYIDDFKIHRAAKYTTAFNPV